jgi:hypothetical protein
MNVLETLVDFSNILDEGKSCKLDELFNFEFVSHPQFERSSSRVLSIETLVAIPE